MPRAGKHRISTKPVFSGNGGGTERDEKFTLKYNKTISPTNSYGTINCVACGAEYRAKRALHQPAHYSLGWKQTHTAFVSLNGLAHFCKQAQIMAYFTHSICRVVIGPQVCTKQCKGQGGLWELKQTAILPLHLLSFFHFFFFKQKKPGLRYSLKV